MWLNSDRMAHDVLNYPEVIALIRDRFGDTVIDSKGQVNRAQLAAIVFDSNLQSAAHKQWLEQLIHPRVRALSLERIANEGAQYPFVIIDAPLLIEAGWGEHCDRILMVDTPLELRQRWAATRGWSVDELARREAAQLPIEEKRRRATDVITNDGSLDALHAQVDAAVRSLR